MKKLNRAQQGAIAAILAAGASGCGGRPTGIIPITYKEGAQTYHVTNISAPPEAIYAELMAQTGNKKREVLRILSGILEQELPAVNAPGATDGEALDAALEESDSPKGKALIAVTQYALDQLDVLDWNPPGKSR